MFRPLRLRMPVLLMVSVPVLAPMELAVVGLSVPLVMVVPPV